MRYYLGVDIGGTKSHALLLNERGEQVGFGVAGAGNHERVGFDGLRTVLKEIVSAAIEKAGIHKSQIAGAGFGLCGYDWESERKAHLQAVGVLELDAPLEIVNDAVLGLLSGAENGWGVSVTAGTSCNCWGRGPDGTYGHVIGMGHMVGEAAGGGELVLRALWKIAHAYTQLGAPTQLTELFMAEANADSPAALLEGYTEGRLRFDASHAPLVFQAASNGDGVAQDIVTWAGNELGKLAIAVIRQLNLQQHTFEVVQAGSLYRGSPLLTQAMQACIHTETPGARLVRLDAPPVVGAALLAMEQAGCSTAQMRAVRAKVIQLDLPQVVS